MKYLYILLICLILFYLISRYFEKYYSQENFDPSLVPVSSIITLAKVAQKIVDGNGTLTNPANLNIGTTSATGNLTVTGNTHTNGYEIVDGTLNVTGATTLSTLGVTGATNVGGDTTVGGTLGVTGATTVGGTLGITGNTTVGGTLGITGATTLTGGVIGGLNVTGTSNLNGDVTIGTSTAGQPVHIYGGDGAMRFSYINGADTYINSPKDFQFYSNASVATLSKAGALSLASGLSAGGNISGANLTTSGNLTVSGNKITQGGVTTEKYMGATNGNNLTFTISKYPVVWTYVVRGSGSSNGMYSARNGIIQNSASTDSWDYYGNGDPTHTFSNNTFTMRTPAQGSYYLILEYPA